MHACFYFILLHILCLIHMYVPHIRLVNIFDCEQTASPGMCEHIPHTSTQTGVIISDEQLDVYK